MPETASLQKKPDNGGRDLDVIAAHLIEHGPVPGCKHIFEQLLALSQAFPGITVIEFIAASAIAVRTEASA